MEEMTAQVAQLAQQVANLTNALAQQQQQQAASQRAEDLGAIVALQQRVMELQAAPRAPGRLTAETSVVEKPFKFKGVEKEFPLWLFKLENYLEGPYPGARRALQWAQETESSIGEEDLAGLQDIVEDPRTFNRELYSALSGLIEGDALSWRRRAAMGHGGSLPSGMTARAQAGAARSS